MRKNQHVIAGNSSAPRWALASGILLLAATATAEVPQFSPALPPPPALTAPLPPLEPEQGEGEAAGALEESFRKYQDAVTVGTTKRAQKLSEVPMTLAWIPGSELEGTGQFTLCDAIQYFPGLECRRGAKRWAAVSSRGLGSNFMSNRLLLLRDGRPETDPWTGIIYPDETTPMINVKQIEVIRGPGSSLYGNSAFSGVINIVTRSPDDLMKDGRDYGVEAKALAGQDDTYRVQAATAGRVGELKGMVTYHGLWSDGPALLSDASRNIVDENEWANVQQVTGKVQYKAAKVDVGYTNTALGRPGGMLNAAVGNCGSCHYTPDDVEYNEIFHAAGQVDGQVTDWLNLFGMVYGNFKSRQVELAQEIVHESITSYGNRRRVGGELRAQVAAGPLNVTLGADTKIDRAYNLNIRDELSQSDLRFDSIGGFVDAELRPHSQVLLGAGARYDWFNVPERLWINKGSQVSPRASIVYLANPALTFRGNYGHAFRAPTMTELGINQRMYASTLVGNPYLRPETLDTYELATDFWPFGDAARVTGTVFHTEAKNFINEEHHFGAESRFTNIGDARLQGFEVEVGGRLNAIDTTFDVGYQFLQTERLQAHDHPETGLEYAPQHRVQLRGHTVFAGNGFADLYMVYVGARADAAVIFDSQGNATEHLMLDPYFVANARVGWKLTKEVHISLLASNVFGASYAESAGFPAPDRRVFTELKLAY